MIRSATKGLFQHRFFDALPKHELFLKTLPHSNSGYRRSGSSRILSPQTFLKTKTPQQFVQLFTVAMQQWKATDRNKRDDRPTVEEKRQLTAFTIQYCISDPEVVKSRLIALTETKTTRNSENFKNWFFQVICLCRYYFRTFALLVNLGEISGKDAISPDTVRAFIHFPFWIEKFCREIFEDIDRQWGIIQPLVDDIVPLDSGLLIGLSFFSISLFGPDATVGNPTPLQRQILRAMIRETPNLDLSGVDFCYIEALGLFFLSAFLKQKKYMDLGPGFARVPLVTNEREWAILLEKIRSTEKTTKQAIIEFWLEEIERHGFYDGKDIHKREQMKQSVCEYLACNATIFDRAHAEIFS